MKRTAPLFLLALSVGCDHGASTEPPPPDASVSDASVPDASVPDASGPDASAPDAGLPDAGDGGLPPPSSAPYPRIALLGIGGQQTYPQADWEFYGRFDLVIMGGNWEGWSNSGRDRELVVQGIKSAVHPPGAAPPSPTRVVNYIMFQEVAPGTSTASPILYDAINQNHWWLYQSTYGGAIAETGNGDTSTAVDYGADDTTKVAFAQPAASGPGAGLRPPEWFAHYFYNVYMSKAGVYGTKTGLGAPSLDGFFVDDMFCEAPGGGDWNRDGIDDGPGIHDPPERWIQQGQANFFAKLQSLTTGKINFGNYGGEYGSPKSTPGPMDQVLHGGLFEALIGKSWSLDTYQTYDMVLTAFDKAFDVTQAPHLVCMGGTIPNGGAMLSGNLPFVGTYDKPSTAVNGEYQWARYNLGTCLLTDGYCVISSQLDHNGANNSYDTSVASQRYYDEYGGNYPPLPGGTVPPLPTSPDGPPRGYLGQPVVGALGVRQTKARWSVGAGLGVFAREFDHGIVIVNPKGNGMVTITTTDLPGKWSRLSGCTQAPAVNSGAAFTGVTLQDRDAIILVRGQ